jgi:fatty acid desaturase
VIRSGRRSELFAVTSAELPNRKTWKRDLGPYLEIDRARSLWQIAGVVSPYLGVWIVASIVRPSPWLAVGLGVVATVILVRMYSFFHDLAHNSMFESRAANARWGHLLGSSSSRPTAGGSVNTACITRTPATSTSADPGRSTR